MSKGANLMARFAGAVALLCGLSALSGPALAAKCKAGAKELAGVYELYNVRETGSVVILAPDGRFGYMFTVGAYDERAEGCWRRRGQVVRLSVTRMEANSGNKKFKTLDLKLNSKGGLDRTYNGKYYGSYERVKKF